MGSLAAPIVSFIAVLLVIFPLPYHLKTKNIAILCLALWIAQWNLFQGINFVVWNGSIVRKWLVYCDITLFLKNAGVFGMIASNMCILRHLEHISSPAYIGANQEGTKRRTRFEILMCIVLPFVFAGSQIIVQPNRFDIYEDFGCAPAIWVSWQNAVIWYAPPLILSVTTFTYAFTTVQWLLLGRRFKRPDLSRSGISTAQFIRLLILAVVLSASAALSTIFQIVVNVKQNRGLGSWVSWGYVHADFWNVSQYPKAIIPPFLLVFAWVFYMLAPYTGVLFFVFFGLSGETLVLLRRVFGLTPKTPLNENRAPEPVSSGPPNGDSLGGSDFDPFRRNPTLHHLRTTLVGDSRPRVTSPRARWEAGDDLDFQSDSRIDDEYEGHDRREDDTGSPRSERAPGTVEPPPVLSSSHHPAPHGQAPERVMEPRGSSELSHSETPLSSPSLYASTEMSHSSPRAVGSPLSDTQRFTLNHQPVIFISPPFDPSSPSAPASMRPLETPLATSIAVSPSRSSWTGPQRIRTKRVQVSSPEITETAVLSPAEQHRQRANRSLSYHFI